MQDNKLETTATKCMPVCHKMLRILLEQSWWLLKVENGRRNTSYAWTKNALNAVCIKTVGEMTEIGAGT